MKSIKEIISSLDKEFVQIISKNEIEININDELRENWKVKIDVKEWDNLIGPLEPGKIILLSGKTLSGINEFQYSLIQSIAIEKGYPVGVILIELDSIYFIERLVSKVGNFKPSPFIGLKDFPEEQIGKTFETIVDKPIFIEDSLSVNINSLKDLILEFKNNGINIIFIDYLNFISFSNNNSLDHNVQEVAQLFHELKDLAVQLGVTIVIPAIIPKEYQNIFELTSWEKESINSIDTLVHLNHFYVKKETKESLADGFIDIVDFIILKNKDRNLNKFSLVLDNKNFKSIVTLD